MRTFLIACLALSLTCNFWLAVMQHDWHETGIDREVLKSANRLAEQNDPDGLLFLGLRSMFATYGPNSDDPRKAQWRDDARDYILKACARSDNAAGLYTYISQSGFFAPDEQYVEAGKLIEMVQSGIVDATWATGLVGFVQGQDSANFRTLLGLDLAATEEMLRQKALNGVKGHPRSSLLLASHLRSSSKANDREVVEKLMSDAVGTLERQGASWNPYAYEYLAELFENGYGRVVEPDPSRASKYKTLFDEALTADRKRPLNPAK